jgi:hypothetical protein
MANGAPVNQPVDSSILHEIVRVIESRRKVPEKVVVKSKEYVLTYLEDHQRRLEEALQRYDADRLNMLYGQLASKIKYQLMRRLPGRAAGALGLGPAKRPATKAPAVKKVSKQPAKASVRGRKSAGAKRKPVGKHPTSKRKKSAARKRR